MNNKGQSLVLFLLVLPIIITFLALFIDVSLVLHENTRLNSVIETTMMSAIDKEEYDLEKIKILLQKNDNKLQIDKLEINDSVIYISATSTEKSLFGNILDFDFYKMKTNLCGNYLTKEIAKGQDCNNE